MINFSVNAANSKKRRKDVRVLMEICLQLRTILDAYEFFFDRISLSPIPDFLMAHLKELQKA